MAGRAGVAGHGLALRAEGAWRAELVLRAWPCVDGLVHVGREMLPGRFTALVVCWWSR